MYKNKSFTRAAEQLYTSQPTVSEHIRNLEAHLGCTLFDRLGRTIIPTKEANILYPRAVAILEDLHKLEGEVAMAGQKVSGELIIGASTIPGAYLLPSVAADFKKQYPDVSFEVRINDSASIISDIQSNNLLLGLVGAKTSARQIEYLHFTDDELVLAASGSNPLGDTISIDEMLKQPFISRESGSGTRKNIEQMFASQKIQTDQLDIVAMLGSSTAVKEAVKSNLGIAFISRYAIKDEVKAGTLRVIDVESLKLERSIYIASGSKRTLPHHYQVFLDTLLKDHSTD